MSSVTMTLGGLVGRVKGPGGASLSVSCLTRLPVLPLLGERATHFIRPAESIQPG